MIDELSESDDDAWADDCSDNVAVMLYRDIKKCYDSLTQYKTQGLLYILGYLAFWIHLFLA